MPMMEFRAALWRWPQTIGLLGHSLGSLGLAKVDAEKGQPKVAAGGSAVAAFYSKLMQNWDKTKSTVST